jgi:hypothetical protein
LTRALDSIFSTAVGTKGPQLKLGTADRTPRETLE